MAHRSDAAVSGCLPWRANAKGLSELASGDDTSSDEFGADAVG